MFSLFTRYQSLRKYPTRHMMDSEENDLLWPVISWQFDISLVCTFWEYVEFQYSYSHLNFFPPPFLPWQMFWRSLMMLMNGIAGKPTHFRGESFSYPFRGRWFAVKSSVMRRSRLPVKWYVKNALQLLRRSLANFQVWVCVAVRVQRNALLEHLCSEILPWVNKKGKKVF